MEGTDCNWEDGGADGRLVTDVGAEGVGGVAGGRGMVVGRGFTGAAGVLGVDEIVEVDVTGAGTEEGIDDCDGVGVGVGGSEGTLGCSSGSFFTSITARFETTYLDRLANSSTSGHLC